MLSSTTATSDLVNAISAEMALGVETAVECWMAQIEQAFTDPGLTTLGRLQAVREVLERYKQLTGKSALFGRRV